MFSLLWRRDSQSLQELLDCYELADSSRSLLISIRCLREHCNCTLNNQEVLMLKAVRDAKLVSGSWNKLRPPHPSLKGAVSPTSSTGSEKSIKVILTDYSSAWFEVLNENGASIPYWVSVKDIARHRPQLVFLRKDQKCLFARNKAGNGNFDLSAESTGILKAGTVLNYIESGKFRVQKNRKVKELPLVKCSDNNGHLVFLGLEDKCAVSPVAGADNISGVHTLESLLTKFQFPISVRPVFGPPLPWLSYSERYNLRLTTCNRGDLLFLASLSNPERFFVVTPEMLDQHAFRVGESELGHHVQLLEKHSTRVAQFLQSYHPFEALRYLQRHLDDATNQLVPRERCLPIPGGDAQVAPLPQQPPPGEVDDLLDEVEDIYFYVRTGRMPNHHQQQLQQQQHSKSNSSNDSGLVLVNPRTRQAEFLGVPAAPRPFRATSCEDLLEGRDKRPQQQQHQPEHQVQHQQTYLSQYQQQSQQMLPPPPPQLQQQQQQQVPQQQSHQPRYGPPPPLPPRKYPVNHSPAAATRHELQQRSFVGVSLDAASFDSGRPQSAAVELRQAAAMVASSNGLVASGAGSNLYGSRGSVHAQLFAATPSTRGGSNGFL